MADEAIKEPDAFITQAPSSQRNGFSQLILPSLGSSFALRHQHQVWQVHRRFLRHLCLLLHLLPVHHAPRPPPARAAHLHCGSCGLLRGHQVPQLLVHLPGHHLSLLASHRGMEIRHPSQLGDHLAQHAHKSHLRDRRLHQVHQLHRHQLHLQAH